MELIKTENLTIFKEALPDVVKRLSVESGLSPDFACGLCHDVGYIYQPDERGKIVVRPDGSTVDYTIAVPCECAIQKKLNRFTPAEYRGINLATVQPDAGYHVKQAEHLNLIRSNPLGSYVLAGDFGTGKSHFFWALYAEAVRARKKTFAGTLRGLIDQFQRKIEASQRHEVFILPIYPDDFRGDQKCALFLDDLDKARPTEYVAEQLFELLDAAVSNKQQVVVTTNLAPPRLIEHFERADGSGRFGGSIVRRLLHNAALIEMF